MKKSCELLYDNSLSRIIDSKKKFPESKTYYNIIYILKSIYNYGMDVEAIINGTSDALEITFTKNNKILKLVFSDNNSNKFSLNDNIFNISDTELYKVVNNMLKNSTYKGHVNNVRRKKCKTPTGSLGK